MSKYDALWDYVRKQNQSTIQLSFEDIGRIAGVPLDHSFLTYKKELSAYGYEVGKISLKGQMVEFHKKNEHT